ncbi:ABC transporter permease [Brevibacterium ravenspurgense]|uniref:ABC transporter permease n=1 Tax=Brevibacterium ravenspurgense TaxID=479117 RepID=A0A2I1IG75_9MICO|nr:FtsX-like permease family protein [Brevibacterium ravenspurgense]PKY70130.1 ABC transporter permease [Brevibacterium ravenspurgense]
MTSPWSRAIRCVTRKPGRTLLMILIMTVVFTALVAQSGVRSTMTEVKNAINTNVGAGFTASGSAGETADEVESGSAGDPAPREEGQVTPGSGETPGAGGSPAVQPGGTSAGSAGIDREVAERLAALPQVARHSLEAAVLARPEGAQPVLGASGVQLDPQFAGDVSVTGTSDSSLNPAFQGKLYRLVEGEHVGADGGSRAGGGGGSQAGAGKPGAGKAIIHREFADHNKLAVGDKLTLTRDGEKVTVTIAGILEGKTENPTGLPSGASENHVFVDLASAQKLGAPLTTGRYFTQNAQQLPEALEAAKGIAPELTLEDNSAQFAPVLQAISGVDRLLGILLLGLCVAGACVLTLVSTFWARGRIHEIGVLLSLGKSKGNVLSQFAIEAGIFAGVAAVIAAVVGTVLSSRLGQAVFAQVGGEALSSLQPSIGVGDVVLALVLGAVIVLIGVSVGVLPLVMQRPKRILAKLS